MTPDIVGALEPNVRQEEERMIVIEGDLRRQELRVHSLLHLR
jgi:hypothetical protein